MLPLAERSITLGISHRGWTPLIVLAFAMTLVAMKLVGVAVAFFGTRYASMGSSGFALPESWSFREKSPRKVVPAGIKPRRKPRRAADPAGGGPDDSRGRDVHESIDPLLDKISKHGLASLTNSERAVLEKARVSLLRKDRRD